MLRILQKLFTKGPRGLEAVEILLVAPLWVMLILFLINGGYAVFANQTVQEAARNGCRQGVVSSNPVQTATQAAAQYTSVLAGEPAAISVGVGVDFLRCEVVYAVPSLGPFFPQIQVRGHAQFRMEGW